MQTKDSVRHGVRFVSALGETSGVRTSVEKFNPHHDAHGRFSAAEEAVISTFANVPEDDLRQRNEDFIHEAEKVGLVGKKGYFVNYIPKAKWTGKEPKEWTDLNRQVGEKEGRANANIAKSEDKTGKYSANEKVYFLARAAVHRAAAIQLTKQRDKIKVEKSVEKALKVSFKIPTALAEELASAGEMFGWEGEEVRMDPAEVKNFKLSAVQDAKVAGLITEEQAKELRAKIEEEEG